MYFNQHAKRPRPNSGSQSIKETSFYFGTLGEEVKQGLCPGGCQIRKVTCRGGDDVLCKLVGWKKKGSGYSGDREYQLAAPRAVAFAIPGQDPEPRATRGEPGLGGERAEAHPGRTADR